MVLVKEAASQEETWLETLCLGILKRSNAFSLLLGRCAVADHSEILKIIAGTIIRELLSRNTPMERFWPNGGESQRLARFPKSQSHTSQWIFDFASFLDQNRPMNPPRQQ